ncbi:phospholipase A2 inhibitor and Ly6/PLAUR domain-containing protein-like [Gopherus evgoodei]|uniref:phospholipase A2 inhibitor and Ly6/PLAUR domain-containing protein-like n=1 Tax=Gopherus evgoodei TaxID=1825980 RepID=UPI0011D003B3|nr:phospholipase A2 inhibitor and Ly6/PLAUR domain-containing protein-like [Gopherus evgoodei]
MVSFILCLLPALLATTSAQTTAPAILTCDTCFGQTETCNFAPGTCQDNKATGGCLSVAEDITLGGTQNTYFYKQCLSSYKSDIEVPISFSVGNGNYVRINTTRCNTDNCNLAVPGVPTGSTTANGLQCPTCFALNFTVCNSSVTPCTGDETYCMDFTGFLYKSSSHSPFQAKGCTTASPQIIKPGAILTTALYTFDFFWGASVPAEKIPTNPPPTTAVSLEKTSPAPNKTTTTPPATATTTTTTTSGGSPSLGRFSFALYLPGLTGLLLVKLLS